MGDESGSMQVEMRHFEAAFLKVSPSVSRKVGPWYPVTAAWYRPSDSYRPCDSLFAFQKETLFSSLLSPSPGRCTHSWTVHEQARVRARARELASTRGGERE